MKSLVLIFSVVFSSIVQAGQCYQAHKESKELEAIVSGVLYISESDSPWSAFASWEPVTETSEEQVRKVLKLSNIINEDLAYFEMSKDHNKAYDFLNNQVEYRYEDADSESEYLKNDAEKLRNLVNTISQRYGKNLRLIQYGSGDGSSFFVGNIMIAIIHENGCVLGLRVKAVWT